MVFANAWRKLSVPACVKYQEGFVLCYESTREPKLYLQILRRLIKDKDVGILQFLSIAQAKATNGLYQISEKGNERD